MEVALGVALGLVTGVLSGMLGVGGGVVMVPGMVLLLGVDQHTAQGVSLAVVVLTAIAGAVTHYRQDNVKMDVVPLVAPGAVLFGLVGSWLAGGIDAQLLSRIFAAVLFIVGGRMLLAR